MISLLHPQIIVYLYRTKASGYSIHQDLQMYLPASAMKKSNVTCIFVTHTLKYWTDLVPTMTRCTKLVLLSATFRKNSRHYGFQGQTYQLTKQWFPSKEGLGWNSSFQTNLSLWCKALGTLWVCNRYCYKFDVYIGKSKNDTNPVLSKSTTVVLDLVKGLEHKNYNIYFDSYHTSVPLLLAVAEKGIGACGTIRANHKYYPKDVPVADVKCKLRGTFAWRSNGSLLALMWKDRKSILFLSSIHQPLEGQAVKHKVKRDNRFQEIEFPCPRLVNDYNKFMGGVDHNDQMTHLRKEKWQKKWYIRLIIKNILMSCYNSYLVFKHFYPGKKIRYPEFKEQLAIKLVGFMRNPRNNSSHKCKATHDRFENVGEHLPEKGEGKNHWCVVCIAKHAILKQQNPDERVPEPSKTTFRCSSQFCKIGGDDTYLCVCNPRTGNNCFKDYHTKVEYWR